MVHDHDGVRAIVHVVFRFLKPGGEVERNGPGTVWRWRAWKRLSFGSGGVCSCGCVKLAITIANENEAW